MTSNFNSTSSTRNDSQYKPRKFKAPTIKKSPEQKKQEKIAKLRQQIAKLRQQKSDLRTRVQQQQKTINSADFRARLNAIDDKITYKMQQIRDTASNTMQKVKDVTAAPFRAAKYAWDQWEI